MEYQTSRNTNRVSYSLLIVGFWCLVLLASLLIPHGSAYAAQITLAWDASDEAVGYKIYYGTTSNNYTSVVDVGNNLTYTFTDLPDGHTYYFAATAYDATHLESDFSTEVSYEATSQSQTEIIWRNNSSTGPYSGMNTIWHMNGANYIGQDWLPTISDTTWQIVGVADFNNDGKPDILWRNTSPTGPYSGMNTVWYMNGATYVGQDWLPASSDLTWQIVGVADFNNDGKPDILWRNTSPTGPYSGMNTVWYMNGATYIGQDWLPTISDTTWQIVGVADFNNDGKPDILWRNTSPTGPYSGMNTVWYMNGATYTGQDWIIPVTDLAWEIVGTGDFNADGHPDILWRNTSSTGHYSGMNTVWYMNGATYRGQAWLPTINDTTWKIVKKQ